jgi:hypothetical protein
MGKAREIIIGEKFGRLLVVARKERRKRFIYFLCRCDCGTEKIIRADCLYTGNTTSCGCFLRENRGQSQRTHGMSATHRTVEYDAWAHMIRRCHTPTTHNYANYGGRGISVCERWRYSFENFLADMGERPSPKHSLDRRDNNGNYEPANCRWATPIEQGNNTRKVRLITYKGKTQSVSAWTRELGFPRETLRKRIATGWPIDLAFTTAVDPALARKARQTYLP